MGENKYDADNSVAASDDMYESEDIPVNENNIERDSGEDNKPEENRLLKIVKELLSWVVVVICAVILAKVITKYVIIKAEVPTGSMEHTINIDDRMVGLRIAYLFSEPERGDIIIFNHSETELYVKRVIGLPGDVVEIKQGVVYINGEVYEEDYLHEEMRKADNGPYEVPKGSYFVMGDNRNHSEDSRAWADPYVSEDVIVGKVLFKYKPELVWLDN